MPFTEQEVTIALQQAHSHLLQWTTNLWGEPIVLTDSGEISLPATLPFMETAEPEATSPIVPATEEDFERASIASHRRRRAHAVFDSD